MKIYLDSANLDDIRECVASGVISGVTVNQSLLAKEPKTTLQAHIDAIDVLLPKDFHLSTPMVAQQPYTTGRRDFAIKIAASWQNLPLINSLKKDMHVNATCIFSVQQAEMALRAGASIVSVFVGRINDAKPNLGYQTLDAIKKRNPNVTVLAGSVRTISDVARVEDCGADIATVSKTVLQEMANEIHSTQWAEKFDEDYAEWIK